MAYWDHPVDSFQPESMMEHLYCQHISQDDENLVSGRNLPCLEQIAGLGVLHGNGGRGQRLSEPLLSTKCPIKLTNSLLLNAL